MAIVLGDPNNISVFGFNPNNDVNLLSTFGWIGGIVLEDTITTNHLFRTKSLLIEQFKRSQKLNDKIDIICDLIQEIEAEGNKLLLLRRIDQASGKQLDGIGEIVGEERNGRNDQDYLDAIYIRIFLNSSSGEPETLIRALEFISNGTDVRIFEYQPAAIAMYTNGSFTPANVVSELDKIVAGGVKILYVSTSSNTIPFSFSNDDGSTPTDGKGFSEYDYTPGGVELGGQIVEGYINQ